MNKLALAGDDLNASPVENLLKYLNTRLPLTVVFNETIFPMLGAIDVSEPHKCCAAGKVLKIAYWLYCGYGYAIKANCILAEDIQLQKETQSGFNAAFKENYPAIGSVSPFIFDYSKVVLSKGTLAPADNPEVTTTVAGSIKFDWTDLIYMNVGLPTDKVTLVVYNPIKDRFVGVMGIVARSVKTYTMQVPGEFSGDMVN